MPEYIVSSQARKFDGGVVEADDVGHEWSMSANETVVELLAKHFCLAKFKVEIVRGQPNAAQTR